MLMPDLRANIWLADELKNARAKLDESHPKEDSRSASLLRAKDKQLRKQGHKI
jgi:hypothetical protein